MKILVVDDSQMMRTLIKAELKEEYTILCAENGEVALAMALEERPDLITFDVDMPVLNGYDACLQLRSNPLYHDVSRTPVIFITANDSISGRSRGFEVGASEFITKPFLRGEVLDLVNSNLKPSSTIKGATVLIAEDSTIARQILEEILKSQGVNVISTASGVEALEEFKKNEQLIDMVITDFMMPEMNGDELCIKIRSGLGNKRVPILFLTGMTERDSILNMFKVGASDYILKPFAKEELLARLKVHLKGQSLNRELELKVIELKRLSKLKDEFLNVTSHDLRAPLNGVLGFAQLLELDGGLTTTQLEFVQNIKQSGEFLLDLINDILYLGRVSSEAHDLELKTVRLSEVVESSTSTLRHMATPKGQKITIHNHAHGKDRVDGDAGSLMRVFNNLLSNAIKFTPKNGEIKQVIELVSETEVSVSVIDSGIGIDKEQLSQLFKKFTKASRPGTEGELSTGLGLAITKELLQRHRAEIEVFSEVNQGTTFKVTFPLSNGEKVLTEEVEIPLEEATPAPKKMTVTSKTVGLVVDDNPLNLKLATHVMKRMGVEFETAKDGQEGLMKYIEMRMQGKPLDFVFMDHNMPVMDGVTSTRRIREFEVAKKISRTPIFSMTAGTSDHDKAECIEAGMDGIVEKPINLTQIQDILSQISK